MSCFYWWLLLLIVVQSQGRPLPSTWKKPIEREEDYGTTLHSDHGTTLHSDHGTTLHSDHATTLHSDHGTTLHSDHETTLHSDHGTTLHSDHGTTLHSDHGTTLHSDHGTTLQSDHGTTLQSDHGKEMATGETEPVPRAHLDFDPVNSRTQQQDLQQPDSQQPSNDPANIPSPEEVNATATSKKERQKYAHIEFFQYSSDEKTLQALAALDIQKETAMEEMVVEEKTEEI